MEPIIGSREKKIHALEARKRELLLRKSLNNDKAEIANLEILLADVENLLKKYNEPTTIRRRIRKPDDNSHFEELRDLP